MSDENSTIVGNVYAAYKRRDSIAVFSLFSPDIEMFQTDELPWGLPDRICRSN